MYDNETARAHMLPRFYSICYEERTANLFDEPVFRMYHLHSCSETWASGKPVRILVEVVVCYAQVNGCHQGRVCVVTY